MLRGTIKFKCDECGSVFSGPDVEWRCSVLTTPVKCKCGSVHTYPHRVGLGIFEKGQYRKIWAELDNQE